jgi:hypothetical protein
MCVAAGLGGVWPQPAVIAASNAAAPILPSVIVRTPSGGKHTMSSA